MLYSHTPISPTWELFVSWGFCAVAGSQAGPPPSSRLSLPPPSWCCHCLSCSCFSSLWLAARHHCSRLGSCWIWENAKYCFTNHIHVHVHVSVGMWNFSWKNYGKYFRIKWQYHSQGNPLMKLFWNIDEITNCDKVPDFGLEFDELSNWISNQILKKAIWWLHWHLADTELIFMICSDRLPFSINFIDINPVILLWLINVTAYPVF